MRATHFYCGSEGDHGDHGRRSKNKTPPPTASSRQHAESLLRSGPPVNPLAATTADGIERPQQRHRCRRRQRPATTPRPLSRIVGALHLALVLVMAAGGRYDGGRGGGVTSEWQHPHRRSESFHLCSSSGGAGAWAAHRSDSGRRGAVRGGWREDEYRGGYGGAGRRRGVGNGGGGGDRGSRARDRGAREEVRGWSERKKVGSDSMREIIELAKADAQAVRAAAEDAAAAAAAATEAEAAWAAAGVGSGGGGGDNAMLFLECEVNGRALRAFVDTGAQVTVMSAACAERCGLASRIDKRFAGRAVGVGFARILGRIHDANIRIGNSYLRCSFTVIEHGEIDLLVGLDVLRAHRCDISLSKNRMKFHAGGGAREVAFLTRVERDGKRRRSRRSPVAEIPSTSHDDDGCYNLDAEPEVAAEPSAPPPRVLREMARGTRGDGVARSSEWPPATRRGGYGAGDVEGAGRSSPSPSMSPQKMRGWPPRGGEEEIAEEIKRKKTERRRRRWGRSARGAGDEAGMVGVEDGRAY
eukprot:g16914.t1